MIRFYMNNENGVFIGIKIRRRHNVLYEDRVHIRAKFLANSWKGPDVSDPRR